VSKPNKILPFKEIETKAKYSRQRRHPNLSLSVPACVSSKKIEGGGWETVGVRGEVIVYVSAMYKKVYNMETTREY
jgi:hypothetical protein